MNEQSDQAPSLSLDELVAAVAARLNAQPSSPEDGRVSMLPDARTVRYYQSLRLVSAPERHGGRACYSQRHVEQVLTIKRAQAAGQRLTELPTPVDAPPAPEPGHRRTQRRFWEAFPPSPMPAAPATESPRAEVPTGTAAWVLDLGEAVLIVPGSPSPQRQAALRAAAGPLRDALRGDAAS